MPLSEQQKRRVIAITKQLKEQKGVSIKQQEILGDIANYKKTQKEILAVKEQFPESAEVKDKVDKNYKKLQNIIDDLNEYMRILHPEGLLDMGSGPSVVSHG